MYLYVSLHTFPSHIQSSLVRVLDDPIHEVVVHQLDVLDVGGAQVQVDLVLLGDALEVVRVGHPGQLVDDLGVPEGGEVEDGSRG